MASPHNIVEYDSFTTTNHEIVMSYSYTPPPPVQSNMSGTNSSQQQALGGAEAGQQQTMQRHRQEPALLGRSASTLSSDGTAKRFYDTYRNVRGRGTTFDNMPAEEIECDNLENEIAEPAFFCSSTPIPTNYVEKFEPPPMRPGREDEPITIIRADTLAQYIGNIIKLFQHRFPDHEYFRGLDVNDSSDVPEFWRTLRPQFLKVCGRFHLTTGSDYVFSNTNVRPIYSSNHYTAPHTRDGHIIDHVSLVDLKYLLKQLINNAKPSSLQHDGPLQHRAIIALTFMCVARVT